MRSRWRPNTFLRALDNLDWERLGALLVLPDILLNQYRQRIVQLANNNRMSAVYPFREHVAASGLMFSTGRPTASALGLTIPQSISPAPTKSSSERRLLDRRAFITIVGRSILTAPFAAEAQAAGKVPRVGYLFYGSPGPSREIDAFRQGLHELGYIEGQSIAVEYRFASGQIERYPGLAAELVRMNVDVIVAPATPQALAAKHATSSIPIVFVLVADAVGAGLITNFARPGGNITGLTSSSAELGGKRLELLKEMLPKASRVAVLYNPTDRSNVLI